MTLCKERTPSVCICHQAAPDLSQSFNTTPHSSSTSTIVQTPQLPLHRMSGVVLMLL